MTERLRSIDPLRHEVPIVDTAGRPTPQFMRQWMQTRSVDEAVGVAADSLTGLLDDFAAHGPRHHAGGDMALDLDSIAGTLDGSKLYGDATFDNLVSLGIFQAIEAEIGFLTATQILASTPINLSSMGTTVPLNLSPLSPVITNLDADKLDGQHGTHYHDAGNLTGTVADARLTANIPRKDTSSTYIAAQIFQRTASNLLAIRFSTAAGAFTEIMVDGSYAMGVGGSPRDIRHRRTAAGVMEIDNNAGGAAELDVTGYGLFGGSTVNAQAVLEARSTARGFLLPRMTTTQRDAISATPVAGLTVYNTTTSKVQTWDGAAWQDHW
jgi:hypothetical protein